MVSHVCLVAGLLCLDAAVLAVCLAHNVCLQGPHCKHQALLRKVQVQPRTLLKRQLQGVSEEPQSSAAKEVMVFEMNILLYAFLEFYYCQKKRFFWVSNFDRNISITTHSLVSSKSSYTRFWSFILGTRPFLGTPRFPPLAACLWSLYAADLFIPLKT